MKMRPDSFLIPLLLSALLASCSPEPIGSALSPTAAEVLTRVEAALGEQAPLDPDEVVVPEGCRLAIETDEYDFETEVVICDEEPTTTTSTTEGTAGTTPTTTPPTTVPVSVLSLTEWMGSEDARSAARRLRRALIEQSGCDRSQDLNALQNLAASAPLEIRDLFLAATQDLRRSADFCNVDVAEWRASTEDALEHLAAITAILEAADE